MSQITIPGLPNNPAPPLTSLIELSNANVSENTSLGNVLNQVSGDATITIAGVLTVSNDAITTAKIIDDAVTLAKLAPGTAGNLISYDALGNPVAVATGTAGQLLTSNGPGLAPTFEDAPDTGVLSINGDTTPNQLIVGTLNRITVGTAAGTTTIDIGTNVVTLNGTQTLTNKTLTTPTIGDFTNAVHDHSNAANGGQLTNTALVPGVFTAITGLGVQSQALDMGTNFIDIGEIATPANPGANVGRLYVRDNASVTDLFFRDSAGTESQLSNLSLTLEGLTDVTISSRAAHQVLVVNAGNTSWVNEFLDNDNLSSGRFSNITGVGAAFNLLTDNTTAVLELEANHTTPTANQVIANIDFVDDDSAGNRTVYARIESQIEDPTDTTEDGSLIFEVMTGGGLSTYMQWNQGALGLFEILRDLSMAGFGIINLNNSTGLQFQSGHTITSGATFLTANVGSGDFFVVNVNGTNEYFFGAAEADFQGNDIVDLRALEFIGDATLPAAGVGYIQENGANSILYNIATGGSHDLTINAVSEYLFNATTADFQGNTITDLGGLTFSAGNIDLNGGELQNVNVISFDTAGLDITNSGGNMQFDIPDTNTLNIRFNATTEYLFDQTEADWNGNNLINVETISLNNAGNDISSDAGGINIDVPTSDFVTLLVNTVDEYEFSATQADWHDNNLINLGRTLLVNRFQYDKGADVASANILTLGDDGNVFDITGTTTINEILATNWQAGSVIHLQFDGILTVTNNSGGTNDILLGDGMNFTTAAGDVLSLFFNGTDWQEICRSTVSGAGGDVTGPASSVDNEIVRFDGTTGKIIQNATISATLSDAGEPTWPRAILWTNFNTSLPAATNVYIQRYFNNMRHNVATSQSFEFTVNGTNEYTFNATGANYFNNNILNTGVLNFDLTGATGLAGSEPQIFYDVSLTPNAIVLNVPSAEEFLIEVNATEEFTFSATSLDLIGNNLDNVGTLNLNAATELTIATGAITAVQSYHRVDTEADAATDDLDTINGGTEGDILIIRAENDARTVSVTEAGNIVLSAAPFALDNVQDTLTLLYDGTNWLEISRSDNGA